MPESAPVLTLPEQLLEKIRLAAQQTRSVERLLVGIAGPPASGKSTLAEELVASLNTDTNDREHAVVVPMDGFHLDNAILDTLDLRGVKGAPHTFDSIGFRHLLQRLCAPNPMDDTAASDPAASVTYFPVFDRAMDLARCAGGAVESHHQIIVLEGNYLLLKRPVWCDLQQYLHLSVFLDVPEDVLEQRLIKRWLDHGLSPDAARERASLNDIPNARLVCRESAKAHLIYQSVRQ